jgi:hypothetical protein
MSYESINLKRDIWKQYTQISQIDSENKKKRQCEINLDNMEIEKE